jgi:hypothetical protein
MRHGFCGWQDDISFPSRLFLGDHPCAALLRSMARDDGDCDRMGHRRQPFRGLLDPVPGMGEIRGMILTLCGATAMILQASLVQDRDA